MSYRDETEPYHMPHLHRMWMGDMEAPMPVAVATQRDGTVRILPTSPAPLLATMEPNDGAEEGGTFRESAPVREKRKAQPMAALGLALVIVLGVPFVIAMWDLIAGVLK